MIHLLPGLLRHVERKMREGKGATSQTEVGIGRLYAHPTIRPKRGAWTPERHVCARFAMPRNGYGLSALGERVVRFDRRIVVLKALGTGRTAVDVMMRKLHVVPVRKGAKSG